ncbi:MAG TPA: hypothetical protein VM580_07550 [Labilithrix sp.]|nr:hypothetical protein [Labilithrix sp.]
MRHRNSAAAPSARRIAVDLRARTNARLPSPDARVTATIVALSEADAGSVASIMGKLPDPGALSPGALVIIPGEPIAPRTLARSVLALLGRTKKVARAQRCSALVARGYVEVGAAEDDKHVDFAWGYAPAARSSDEP